ncbi:MAG: RT0821/Lpp0805 family surface protein [Pseudomonadota bacterium]
MIGALALGLAACAGPDGRISKQTIGTGVGAAAGAGLGSLIGSGSGRTVAIIAGGVLGALVGSELGRTMDENDRLRAAAATQEALETFPSGRANTWENPDSGFSGTVTPGPQTASSTNTRPCRSYSQTIQVDGRQEIAEGVACRDPNTGTWRIVSG